MEPLGFSSGSLPLLTPSTLPGSQHPLSFLFSQPFMSKGTPTKAPHHLIPLCSATPIPNFQIPAPAKAPGRAQPLLSRDCSTPEAFAFLPSEGNKSNERNDGAICSQRLSPALTRPFIFVTLSQKSPGQPRNCRAFPWHPQKGGKRSIKVHPFTWRATGRDGGVVSELEMRQTLGQSSFRGWSQADTSQGFCGSQKPVSVVTLMTSLGWPEKDVEISPSKTKG